MNRHLQSLRVVAIFTLTLAHLGSSMGCKARIPTSSPARSSVASAPEDARSARLREAKQSLAAARATRRVEIPTTPEVKATTGVARYILVIKAHRHVSLVGLDDSGRLVKGFKARLLKVNGDDVVELRSGSERLITTAKRGVVMSTLSPESINHLSAVSGQIAHADVEYDTCSDDGLLLGAALAKLAVDGGRCTFGVLVEVPDPFSCVNAVIDIIAVRAAYMKGDKDGCTHGSDICLPGPDGKELCENFDCSTDSECQARFDPLGYDVVWGCTPNMVETGTLGGTCDFQSNSDLCAAKGGVYNADDEICQPPPCADDYEYDSGTHTCRLTDRAACAAQGMTLSDFDICAPCPPGSSFDQTTLGCAENQDQEQDTDRAECAARDLTVDDFGVCVPCPAGTSFDQTTHECVTNQDQDCDPLTDPSCAGVCVDEPLLCEPDECFDDGTNWCDASNGY